MDDNRSACPNQRQLAVVLWFVVRFVFVMTSWSRVAGLGQVVCAAWEDMLVRCFVVEDLQQSV